jgi:hypothetical protein
MKRPVWLIAALLAFAIWRPLSGESVAQSAGHGQATSDSKANPWTFAVSGDSRNCGDVVMPAIAAGVAQKGASFYWHLGDFRKTTDFDEDMQRQPEHLAKPLSISEYEELAWDDFIQSQIVPFGSLPVYLAIGNHETAWPKTREQFIIQFADWLDVPSLRSQRLLDDPRDRQLRTYYHWIENGVDFITLDNATRDQFDSSQLKWFEKVLASDSTNPKIRTIVAGMHEALPESISKSHSMNESPAGTESGRRVYVDLLKTRDEAHKHVYVLASHSHYFMDGIFNTRYWRANGGVLPGWIIGTAGAQRYALPKESADARTAETNVYGFLLGRVSPDGEIEFSFQHLTESDVPASVVGRYTAQFVHWCFAENSIAH